MSFEIEIKAHIADNELNTVKSFFDSYATSLNLGEIDKDDVYWGRPDNLKKAVFRTRREKTSDGYRILFTAKPQKTASNGIECNTEIEFSAQDSWEECLSFQKALGFTVVRHKFKTGWHYLVKLNGFEIHAEILNIKYLGYFLEMEICPETLEGFNKEEAVKTLKDLLILSSLSLNAIEARGYNDMLIECGHQLG